MMAAKSRSSQFFRATFVGAGSLPGGRACPERFSSTSSEQRRVVRGPTSPAPQRMGDPVEPVALLDPIERAKPVEPVEPFAETERVQTAMR